MKLLTAILSLFRQPPVIEIDHVEVDPPTRTAKKFARARADAAKRHGRPFRCDEKKARETPPSRDLIELQQVAPKAQDNVARIGKSKARSS